MRYYLYCIIYLTFYLISLPVHADLISADLADHSITINTSFSGRDVLLFGSTGGRGDIIVVVKGPRKDFKIRKKEKKFNIWMNNAFIHFRNVPSYYAVASNKPVEELLPAHIRKRHEIGPHEISLDFEASSKEVALQVGEYQSEMINLFQKKDLYFPTHNKIHYRVDGLFRTTLSFPAHVPTGQYDVEIYQVQDGRLISAQSTPLIIQKVGLEAWLYDWSIHNSIYYGIMAIFVALIIGWVSTMMMRKSR